MTAASSREWQANPPKGYPTLSKANLAPTKAAIARYEEIVAEGGFPLVPDVELEPGAIGPGGRRAPPALDAIGRPRRGSSSYPDHFGSDLDTAVKRFQASNGLAPTGMVDKRTIAALNVPSEVRLAQLKTNLTRLTDLTKIVGKRYVLVNIPAAQVETVENNAVVSRHSGVVGKPDRPTPMLRSTITDLAFNPIWTLPPTVIKEDLIPKGRDMQQRGAGSVLVKFGIDAYEGGKKVDPGVDRLDDLASDAACRIGRCREKTTRSASSRSTSQTRVRSICTTVRRSLFSGVISELPARDVCACKTSRSWPRGCLPGRGAPSRSST